MRLAVALFPLLAVGLGLAAPVPKEEAKLKPATDKERDEVKENLKQIVLAMHNHHDTTGAMPADIVDPKTKKPLLSWRVHLLPYMEETPLYQQFKLDEPWDSKNNKPLIEKLPKIYAPARVKAKPGETFYRGFAGKGEFAGVFEPGVRLTIASVTDGTSNTIAVIDAGEPVVWTQPGTDLPVDPKKGLPKLGGMIDGDFYCAMMDGSVKTVKRAADEKALRAAISRSGGEVYEPNGVFVER